MSNFFSELFGFGKQYSKGGFVALNQADRKEALPELNKYFTEVSKEEAKKIFKEGKEVFGIDYEGHKGLIEHEAGLEDFEMYAVEKEDKEYSIGGLVTTFENPLDYLKQMGATPYNDTHYTTKKNGIYYYAGEKNHKAIVVAFIQDEDKYMLDKEDLREMSATAKTKNVDSIELYTNYGIELHGKHEKPQTVGFDKIFKVFISVNDNSK